MRVSPRSEEHTSELQSQSNLVCRLLLEKKNTTPFARISNLAVIRSIHIRIRKSSIIQPSAHPQRREELVGGAQRRDLHLRRVFYVNGTSPTVIYTLSLHDALPISTSD